MRRLCMAALCLALSACFVNTKIPLDTDLDRTQLGSKVGTSQAQSILWLVLWGDAGTQAAAQQGGLTTINHADTEIFIVLFGIYARERTVVYGD